MDLQGTTFELGAGITINTINASTGNVGSFHSHHSQWAERWGGASSYCISKPCRMTTSRDGCGRFYPNYAQKGTNSLPSVVHSSTRKTASQISSTPRGQIRTIWFITMDFSLPGAIGYKNMVPLWFLTVRGGIQRWPPRGRQFSSQMLSHTGWIITIDPDWAPPCGTRLMEVWSSEKGQRFKRGGWHTQMLTPITVMTSPTIACSRLLEWRVKSNLIEKLITKNEVEFDGRLTSQIQLKR